MKDGDGGVMCVDKDYEVGTSGHLSSNGTPSSDDGSARSQQPSTVIAVGDSRRRRAPSRVPGRPGAHKAAAPECDDMDLDE